MKIMTQVLCLAFEPFQRIKIDKGLSDISTPSQLVSNEDFNTIEALKAYRIEIHIHLAFSFKRECLYLPLLANLKCRNLPTYTFATLEGVIVETRSSITPLNILH